MRKMGFVLLLTVFIVATACSSEQNSGTAETNRVDTEVGAVVEKGPEEAKAKTEAENSGPETIESAGDENQLTLEDDGVDEERFAEALSQFPAEKPTRMITTSVPLAEMMYLLDITPVGVPTSTNPLPEAFDSIERIGSPMQPDLEIVTSLESDLLLGAESLRSTLEKNLETIKLERAYLPTDSFEDLKLSFKVLGTYFGRTEKMNEVLSSILAKENELNKLAEGRKLPTVMLMIGTSDSFMVMGEGSYLGSLVKRLGADNIATSVLKVDATYSAIDLEQIIAADPDIILVLASGDHGASVDKFDKEVEKNNTWTKLSAYKNDKIHILDYSVFGVTSISNVEQALTQVANYFFE